MVSLLTRVGLLLATAIAVSQLQPTAQPPAAPVTIPMLQSGQQLVCLNAPLAGSVYNCDLASAVSAIPAGMTFWMTVTVTNPASCAINLGGIGPSLVYTQDGTANVPAASFVLGEPMEFFFDGTYWRRVL